MTKPIYLKAGANRFNKYDISSLTTRIPSGWIIRLKNGDIISLHEKDGLELQKQMDNDVLHRDSAW